ncbi:MAG: hypothetical protein AVDCRST_MAG69-2114, partial [uncultured Solirubrobacteraceae bacterium]
EGAPGQGPRSGRSSRRQLRAHRPRPPRRAAGVHAPRRGSGRRGGAARHAHRRQAPALHPRDRPSVLRGIRPHGGQADQGAPGPARRDPRLRRSVRAARGLPERPDRRGRPRAGARRRGHGRSRPRGAPRRPPPRRPCRHRRPARLRPRSSPRPVRHLRAALERHGAQRLRGSSRIRAHRAPGGADRAAGGLRRTGM